MTLNIFVLRCVLARFMSLYYLLFMLILSLLMHVRQLLGWSGGAMVLGKLPVPGRPTILITVRQGPIALAVGAGGGCLDIFTLFCLWETARYRLKYCLKGPFNPKQPTANCTNGSRLSGFMFLKHELPKKERFCSI